MTQKPYSSDQVITICAILNQDIALLASNLYYLLNSKCIKCIYQANQCTCCYFESSYTSASLKPVSAIYLKKGHNHSLICHHQGLFLCNLIYLTVVYFTFIYFTSNLITFINSVLKLY